jgi:tetratricopeptide (TPR) repeat protein
MIRPFTAIFIVLISLAFCEEGVAESIYSHFDKLPLMREEAVNDGNERAIKDIDYVIKTEDGEFFEVDNERPPIETLVTKKNKSKQSKLLGAKKDEDLLIEYYKKVNVYGDAYNRIKNDWLVRKTSDDAAARQFYSLFMSYPRFSSAARAAGVIYLSKGQTQEAGKFFREALMANEKDTVALTGGSIAAYDLGNKGDSRFYIDKAKAVDPTLSFLTSWEVNYIQTSNPEVYRSWAKYLKLR